MKHPLHLQLLLIPLLLSALTSCDIHMSDNGDLDGFWQLARIDTLQGGSADVRSARLFWSVQSDLLQVSDLTYRHDAYILRFDHQGSTLRLSSPYLVDHAGSDVALTDSQPLHPYGIQHLDETFTIERLDADKLSLQSSLLRLEFNRY